MPTDRVLIEIVTAANMAGVEQAKSGMLGLSTGTLALAAALGIAITVGKAAIENQKAHETATNDLNQAVTVFNDGYGKATVATEKQTGAIQKAQAAQEAAMRALTLYNLEHEKTAKTEAAQEVIDIHRAELQGKLAAATANLNEAEKVGTTTKQSSIIYQASLNKELATWLEANKRYVPNQYDATQALASSVRAGNNAGDAMRMLNDALDLTAIKGGTVSDQMSGLIKAEAGNSKSLRDLGITTDQYNNIMKGTGTLEERHQALLALIETKTKDGRKTTDELQQSQQAMNKEWQDFTVKAAPLVYKALDDIFTAADRGIQIVSELWDIIAAIIASPGKLGTALSVIAADTGITSTTRRPGGRASGGPVSAGGAYLVGERGPEMLVMGSSSGTIVPNGAGGGVTINLYATVADGPSLDRFANQIAQRLGYVTGR